VIPSGIITLTTDFGSGPFPGIMKGVILGICPHARIVDIAHDVPAQDVWHAAVVVEQLVGYFPTGTVHVVVVDPGVGTKRRAIVVRTKREWFVAPDNGVLTRVLGPGVEVREVAESRYCLEEISNTFHGRDVFAPVAAHLAMGADMRDMGPVVDDPFVLPWPEVKRQGQWVEGEVVRVDPFGNLGTNIPAELVEKALGQWEGHVELVQEGRVLARGRLVPSYGWAEPGEVVGVRDSMNRLELAVNQGSMLRVLGLERSQARGLKVRAGPLEGG